MAEVTRAEHKERLVLQPRQTQALLHFVFPMAARLTALVTGGASGLGRATALNLAARGMGVVVADITNETDFEDSNIRYAQTDVSSLLAFPSIQHVDVHLNLYIFTLVFSGTTWSAVLCYRLDWKEFYAGIM